jgi:hypothetical protein
MLSLSLLFGTLVVVCTPHIHVCLLALGFDHSSQTQTTRCHGPLFRSGPVKYASCVLLAEASLNAVQGRVSSERYAAMVAHTSNPSAHAAVLFEEANLACDLTSYVHPPPLM